MRRVGLALSLVGFVACSAPGQDGWNRAASPASSRSALAAIQTRDHKVTWLVGRTLRVEDAKGTVIADGVTTDDLERIDPFLHAACTSAVAGPYLDARGELAPAGSPVVGQSTALWSNAE